MFKDNKNLLFLLKKEKEVDLLFENCTELISLVIWFSKEEKEKVMSLILSKRLFFQVQELTFKSISICLGFWF